MKSLTHQAPSPNHADRLPVNCQVERLQRELETEVEHSKQLQDRLRAGTTGVLGLTATNRDADELKAKLTEDLTGLVVLRVTERPLHDADAMMMFECLLTDVKSNTRSASRDFEKGLVKPWLNLKVTCSARVQIVSVPGRFVWLQSRN